MQLDYAKNNKINYSEFISATIDVSAFLTEQKLEAIFLSFDAHNTGKLTKENIKASFEKFGRDITDEEIDEIIKQHDKDGNNAIDLEEFKVMMLA